MALTFEENPFRVLNVSIHDTKATIVDTAEDLTFMNPDDEEIIERARDILLNPRKRIAAEAVLFFCDVYDIILQKNFSNSKELTT